MRRGTTTASVAEAAPATSAEVATGSLPQGKLDYVKGLFTDMLEVSVPVKLEVFLSVLEGSDYHVLDKDEWRQIGGDLHPFMLPLATRGEGDDVEVVGLLIRRPNGVKLMPNEYIVVTQRPCKSWRVTLLAPDMGKYIMRRAEEANFRREKQDLEVIEATKDVYGVRFKGSDKTALDKWLLLEVGAFPDVYKHLAYEKIAGDDPRTGLVIADTMRDAFGEAWAFPHAFCSRVLRKHFKGQGTLENRQLEADHCAQQCLRCGYPLWTLEEEGDSLDDLVSQAKLPRQQDVSSLRVFYLNRATDDQRAAVRTGSLSMGCATMAKGQALMDAVCCGHKSFAGIRQELSDLYDEVPGCESLVNMINYFMPK